MIHFNQIDRQTFLKEYWQKKPLLIKQALPNFLSPLSPEELAGLSLEPEVESRIVIQHGTQDYELKTGPFDESTYAQLPEENWTLLVQGVDRWVPEVTALLDEFNFIPQWRVDDIMISYATKGGNVGPHFDHYDVFLLQGAGMRQWQLTQQDCEESNYLPNVPLRLMARYEVEETYICEPGDILYIPPKWGHHGVSLDNECMSYSIGYRSYRTQELWDTLGDYFSEHRLLQNLYPDPDWSNLPAPASLTDESIHNAQQCLLQAVQNATPQQLTEWFGRFATQLDATAVAQLPEPIEADDLPADEELAQLLAETPIWMRDPFSRFATYQNANQDAEPPILLFVNGQSAETCNAQSDCVMTLANQRFFQGEELAQLFSQPENRALIRHAIQQQWLQPTD